jgi:hypothetical protein
MVTAFLTNMVLLPALVQVFKPRFIVGDPAVRPTPAKLAIDSAAATHL